MTASPMAAEKTGGDGASRRCASTSAGSALIGIVPRAESGSIVLAASIRAASGIMGSTDMKRPATMKPTITRTFRTTRPSLNRLPPITVIAWITPRPSRSTVAVVLGSVQGARSSMYSPATIAIAARAAMYPMNRVIMPLR